MTWRSVWKHQLRWARTIRVCQPAPYFFSILSNAGFWALLWAAWGIARAVRDSQIQYFDHGFAGIFPTPWGLLAAGVFFLARIAIACDLQYRLTRSSAGIGYFWLVPVKDLLQAAIWLCSFLGNRIEWRGQVFKLRRDGTLEKISR